MDSTANGTRISAAEELGPNCEVGTKLRALYASIQDEAIPDRFLDLLEKLDAAEHKQQSENHNIGGS
ncbi:NepR family anti-sigma factor [Paenochrobactrum glaciei]|uniref:Anti-sigma factor NepR domain-containing protein n=1 Tax=Paenochrobactrum glaciei TaxID=486407 RepID=A0ABP3RKK2_9HYPH